MLGLSATPKRKDGLSKVFEWFIGDMVYCKKNRDDDHVLVEINKYYHASEEYSKEIYTVTNNICMPRMINNICAFKKRNAMIYEILINNVDEGRDILILSDRRQHLTDMFDYVNEHNIGTIGFYVGGMKPDDLRETTTKQIILGTFSMASEGMDIPKLNTIILASPKSDIIQSVGRILRQKPEDRKHIPKIIDIFDDFSTFSKQGLKRKAYYKKCKYSISIIDMDGSVETIDLKTKRKSKNKIEDCSQTSICMIED
tara:strand:- start:132 stop:899 length:768 start_codon:yes stop_codon:yes gene_type:complete